MQGCTSLMVLLEGYQAEGQIMASFHTSEPTNCLPLLIPLGFVEIPMEFHSMKQSLFEAIDPISKDLEAIIVMGAAFD